MSYLDVLQCARSIASAMEYCQVKAIPGSMVLHRDLKPDNIGFTLNGQVKVIDFGLAKIVDNASAMSDEVYIMSGETGSLRYMAPEVADSLPYNHKADVYSFGTCHVCVCIKNVLSHHIYTSCVIVIMTFYRHHFVGNEFLQKAI